MKKTGIKWITVVLALLVLSVAALFTVAAVSGDVNGDGSVNLTDAVSVLKNLVGLSSSDADANGDSQTDLSDATAILGAVNAQGPKLTSLSLDDGTSLGFAADKYIYNVTLPEGRPRIPRVSASAASGDTVTVYQATFADDQTEAMAKVVVKGSAGESTYQVRFVKDKTAGFELQYDDRYTYKPTAYQLNAGESFAFSSSNSSVASVDANGVITAKAVSSSPVTITAKVNGAAKETLVIQKINKAQLSVFLIVGQSNAAGSSDSGVDRTAEKALSDAPTAGKAYCLDVAHTGSYTTPYDLSAGRNGFSPALAKTWYNMTGEKVFCIQSAVGGSPIQNWEKGGDRYYGNGSKNLYDNTLAAYTDYKTQYAASSSNFEIVRTHYYWCQGETAMTATWYGDPVYNWSFNLDSTKYPANYVMTAEDYYTRFTAIHNNFVADMDVEVGGIMLVRCVSSKASDESKSLQLLTDLVPARAAQYTLHNDGASSLAIASRLCDISRMETSTDKVSPGWGYMGPANLHYLQRGYNAQGIELATNAFAMVNAYSDRTATDLEVIDSDGRTRFTDGQTITMEAGTTKQIAAIVLPLYAEDKNLTFTVTAGAAYCSVDKYGMITIAETALGGSKATVTIANGSGLKKTLNIDIEGAVELVSGTFRYDFNDLTESNGAAALTDSALSTKGYSFADGIMTTSNQTTDFVLSGEVYLSDAWDWSFEWKGKQDIVSASLFGRDQSNNDFVYLAGGVSDWNYPFRMVGSDGTAVQIPFGDYRAKLTSMNTWKAVYSASTKLLTFSYLNGTTWETVGTATVPTGFTCNVTNLLGRHGSVNVNYKGQLDYVTITGMIEKGAVPTTKMATYRWDFNGDLNETGSQGALVDGPSSTKGYSMADGLITLTDRTTDFTLPKAITLNQSFDWSFEWRGRQNGVANLLFGADSSSDFVYLAYTVNFGGNVGYPIRLACGTGGSYYLSYGDYKQYCETMHTWKVAYTTSSKTITLSFMNDTTGAWETVSSVTTSADFSLDFTSLFGRLSGSSLNYRGEIDYVTITGQVDI